MVEVSKTILITGTISGFGKLTTITLSKEGHSVIATIVALNKKNAAVAKELAALPKCRSSRNGYYKR
jgi:NADP-dependent 3-hydroxy acid dehydrogenase YdfG